MMLIQITGQPTDYRFIVFIFIYTREIIQLFLAEMLPNLMPMPGGGGVISIVGHTSYLPPPPGS